MEEYDIENIISNMDFRDLEFQNIGNGILLTNKEIGILDKYKINYKNCKSLKEILYLIEEVIEEVDDYEDLDYISSTISERDYYINTNK